MQYRNMLFVFAHYSLICFSMPWKATVPVAQQFHKNFKEKKIVPCLHILHWDWKLSKGQCYDSGSSTCTRFIKDLFTTTFTFKIVEMCGSTCEWAFLSWGNSEPAVLTVLGRKGARGKTGLDICFFLTPGAWARESDSAGSEQGARGVICFFLSDCCCTHLAMWDNSFWASPSCSHTECDRLSGRSKPCISWLWLTSEGSDTAQ